MNSIQAGLDPPGGAKFIIQCGGGPHLADLDDLDAGEIWIESRS
jgi:hypothetical protein